MSDDDTIGVIDRMMTSIHKDEERGIPRRVAIAYHVAAIRKDIITVRGTVREAEPEPAPEPEPAAASAEPTSVRTVRQTIRSRRLEEQTERQLLRGLVCYSLPTSPPPAGLQR